MERRIKLSTEDLGIIAQSLEDTRDSAIDAKRELDPTELAEQIEYIDQVGRLMFEFKERYEADKED